METSGSHSRIDLKIGQRVFFKEGNTPKYGFILSLGDKCKILVNGSSRILYVDRDKLSLKKYQDVY